MRGVRAGAADRGGDPDPLVGRGQIAVRLRFPYGSGEKTAADWTRPQAHETKAVRSTSRNALLERGVDHDRYRVSLAWSVEGKLKKGAEHEYLLAPETKGDTLDLLVTDLAMPRLGGEELIRVLRTERPRLPVAVVTGSPPAGGVEALRRFGGGDGPLALLCKPFDDAALTAALRDLASAVGGPAAFR